MSGRADREKSEVLIKRVLKAGGGYGDDRTSSGDWRGDVLMECICWGELTNTVDVFRPADVSR